MASSRIFVRGLPPTFTEDEFRKHFSQNGQRAVTDAKLFPKRRIGYVGFHSAEEAQRAVKYFNKTFIRMSRIGVEIATPVDETTVSKGRSRAPTGLKDAGPAPAASPENKLKRKRDAPPPQEEQDPKLKEFLQVMAPKSRKKAWEADADLADASVPTAEALDDPALAEGESDDEYQEVARKPKREASTVEKSDVPPVEAAESEAMQVDEPPPAPDEDAADAAPSGPYWR